MFFDAAQQIQNWMQQAVAQFCDVENTGGNQTECTEELPGMDWHYRKHEREIVDAAYQGRISALDIKEYKMYEVPHAPTLKQKFFYKYDILKSCARVAIDAEKGVEQLQEHHDKMVTDDEGMFAKERVELKSGELWPTGIRPMPSIGTPTVSESQSVIAKCTMYLSASFVGQRKVAGDMPSFSNAADLWIERNLDNIKNQLFDIPRLFVLLIGIAPLPF